MYEFSCCIPIILTLFITLVYNSLAGSPPWINQGSSVVVTVNHTPTLNEECDFQLTLEFFRQVKLTTADNAYDSIVGQKFANHSLVNKTVVKKDYFMDPKNMCIKTDEAGNIDIHQFDCRRDWNDPMEINGTCECGEQWSRIDLNDPDAILGLDNTSHSYEYQASEGLDKFLVKEAIDPKNPRNFTCVADRFGHCTLEEGKESGSGAKTVTKCLQGYKCRNITISNPIHRQPFHNPRTGEWYGICIIKNAIDEVKSPFGVASRCNNIDLLTLAVSFFICTVNCQV